MDYPLSETEKSRGVSIGNFGGGHVEATAPKKETLNEKMERLADKADEIVEELRKTKKSYLELVPVEMREAIGQIVEGNREVLLNEFRGKDIVFVENQLARRMATRLKAVELLAAEDKYRKVDSVEVEGGLFAIFRNGEKKYKKGTYMAVTFKGSIVMVDADAFTEKGGRVIYKRLPLRESKGGVVDSDCRLRYPAVHPETLAVGKAFDFTVIRTSDIRFLYFKPGGSLSDESSEAVDKLYGAVDRKLAAVLYTT